MARSRRARRSVARVIMNPSGSRRARTRRNPKRSRRKAPRVLRANPKRRRSSKRRSYRARSRRTRTNPKRRVSRKARRSGKRRSYRARSRRSSRRRNPAYKLSSRNRRGLKRVRSNPRRRYSRGRRRNPGYMRGVSGMFRRLPFIGGPLATALAALPAGAIAGVTVELPLRAAPYLADKAWVPDFIKTNEFAYFTLLGGISGGVLAALMKATRLNLPFIAPSQVAALVTAAGAGAGWAKMRTRQLANEAGIATPEQQATGTDDAVAGLGALTMQMGRMGALSVDMGGMGGGPAYSVHPGWGGMGGGYGAVVVNG